MEIRELFTNQDASVAATSDIVSMQKRTNWDLVIDTTGLDGTPEVIIEVGYNLGKCHPDPTEWYAIENPEDCTFVFPITTTPTVIKKKEQTANWLRVRIEPNGNTTGNITALLAYKDYP